MRVVLGYLFFTSINAIILARVIHGFGFGLSTTFGAAISRTLTRLEKKGIICRETGRERGNAIRLTAKGETAVKKLSRPVTEHRQQALQGFSTEEREQLMSFMMRMADNLQQK